MLKRVAFCLLTLVLCAALSHAHGDPIIGTVTALNGDKLEIRDRNNKPVEIMLEKATQYFINDKPATKAAGFFVFCFGILRRVNRAGVS